MGEHSLIISETAFAHRTISSSVEVGFMFFRSAPSLGGGYAGTVHKIGREVEKFEGLKMLRMEFSLGWSSRCVITGSKLIRV